MSLLQSAVDHGVRMLGYERIKTEQLDTVENLLSGKDVFSSLPTRFGKSLVYQPLPFCTESLLRNRASPLHSPSVVVMSPLLSLMYDQVAKLIAKGVKAVCISGEKPSDAFADTVEGRVNHVIGSPESFIGNTSCHALFTDDRFSGQVVALAIDEAHCIVKW